MGAAMSGKPDMRAHIVVTCQAELAVETRDGRVDGDPGAYLGTVGDNPGTLVAEDQRFGQHRVTDPAVGIPV